MLFGSESLRPATWYPQPAPHIAAPINAIASRLLMAPVSPRASPHSTLATEYYPPLPIAKTCCPQRDHFPAEPGKSNSLPPRSRCLALHRLPERSRTLLPCKLLRFSDRPARQRQHTR